VCFVSKHYSRIVPRGLPHFVDEAAHGAGAAYYRLRLDDNKKGLEKIEVEKELSSSFVPVVYYLDQLVTIAVSLGQFTAHRCYLCT
jgi:hypothetical protein